MARERKRCSSLDRNQFTMAGKLSKLLEIFKVKPDFDPNKLNQHRSEPDLTKQISSTSEAQPRRRFVRVVRDRSAPPPEQTNENPHTVVRYSQKFLVEHYNSKDPEEVLPPDKPYEIDSEIQSILKNTSTDSVAASQQSESSLTSSDASLPKKATFVDEVEVIEYSDKDKIDSLPAIPQIVPLKDDDEASPDDVTFSVPDEIVADSPAMFDLQLNDFTDSGKANVAECKTEENNQFARAATPPEQEQVQTIDQPSNRNEQLKVPDSTLQNILCPVNNNKLAAPSCIGNLDLPNGRDQSLTNAKATTGVLAGPNQVNLVCGKEYPDQRESDGATGWRGTTDKWNAGVNSTEHVDVLSPSAMKSLGEGANFDSSVVLTKYRRLRES